MSSSLNYQLPSDTRHNPNQIYAHAKPSEEVSFSDLPKQHLDWECRVCGKRLCLHDISEAPARCPLCGFDYTL